MSSVQTQELPISSLVVPPYQRDITTSKVDEIVRDFKPHLFFPLQVSLRDGIYYLFDGNHRRWAATKLGRNNVVCNIHYDMTYEQEAEAFGSQGSPSSTALPDIVRFWAFYEAKRPNIIAIERIVRDSGLAVQRKGERSTAAIKAVRALQDIYDRGGEPLLARTLAVIVAAWPGVPDAIEGQVLRGLGLAFLHRYRDHKVDNDRLVKQLSREGFFRVERKANEVVAAANNAHGQAFGQAITYFYNLRQTRNRLPAWHDVVV